MNPARVPEPAGEDHVYLIGRASLREYLNFMTTEPVGAAAADRGALAAEWRAAHDRLRALRRAEEDWADDVRPGPLPANLEPLAARVAADPIFRSAFDALPTRVALVELDRLVVSQKTIHLAHVRRLRDRLEANPTPEQIFRLCLPADHPQAGYRVGRDGTDSVVFVSNSDDLRFQESVVLAPDQVTGYRPFGPVAGVVGLVVGFGSGNFNAVSCEGRLVLNNGYHRAYAPRELGVTHGPGRGPAGVEGRRGRGRRRGRLSAGSGVLPSVTSTEATEYQLLSLFQEITYLRWIVHDLRNSGSPVLRGILVSV